MRLKAAPAPWSGSFAAEDRAMFDSYALWRASALGAVTDRVELRALLAAAGEVAGRRVLDVGCGDGVHLRALADRGAALGVGLDLSPARVPTRCASRSLRSRSTSCGR